METILSVEFNENQLEQMFLDELKKQLQAIERRHVFWDLDELCKQTCMSQNNVKDKFFYDPRFPKRKVGGKWMMPAKECEDFLLQWMREQPKH